MKRIETGFDKMKLKCLTPQSFVQAKNRKTVVFKDDPPNESIKIPKKLKNVVQADCKLCKF